LIVAVDVEGSTERANPVKAELRRILYELLDQALEGSGITPQAPGAARPRSCPNPPIRSSEALRQVLKGTRSRVEH
jgi:hypothetical protein